MKRLLALGLLLALWAVPAEAQFTDFNGNGLPQPTIPYFGNHGAIEIQVLLACEGKTSDAPCYDP